MRATNQRRWRAIQRCSGVCLALCLLSCNSDSKSDSGGPTTATNDTSGAGGSSGPSGNSGGSGGSGGSTTGSTSAAGGSGGSTRGSTSAAGGSGGSTTGSTSAAGGSGGTGSDVTSSSSGGGAAGAPENPGVPIPFSDGWASDEHNDLEIQGSFYTFQDSDSDIGFGSGESSIEPEDFADGGEEICADGTIVHVMEGPDGSPNYAAYWGAAIGFNLQQEEGEDTALPYDATEHGLIGFSFVVSGSDPIPPVSELRFNLKVAGDTHNYCRRIETAGVNTFLLTDLRQSCWDDRHTPEPPDLTQLEAIHWQYVASSDTTYDFDICISDLRAIVEPE